MSSSNGSPEQPPAWWLWLRDPYPWHKFKAVVPGVSRPQLSDLWFYGVLCTILMLLLRGMLHYSLLKPLGQRLKLSDRRVRLPGWFAARTRLLEPLLGHRRRLAPAELKELARTANVSERSVENWLRLRRNRDKPTQLARFTECSWYLIYYTVFVTYGLVLQWNEPHFWDSRHLWLDWPQHHLSRAAFWYYMLELGFYASSLITLTADIKRKDFYELTAHHLVTIGLILLSWAFNFTRVGLLTLVIHDAVDPLLSFGKLAKYLGAQKLSDATFGVFLIVWVLSRLVALPIRVVYSVYAHSLPALEIPPCLVYYMFVGMFVLLQVLHCVWTYYIFRIVLYLLRTGQTDGDIRSDSEMSDNNEVEDDDDLADNNAAVSSNGKVVGKTD
ncbi:hypothetical protein BOX15_Mlig001345g2 [Macrostomum lignano]|uniref:TLC domain-containing protein n=1 Tax=Macrostomum lignano TaxID=282301 RepID=A0A267ETV8_9PLAT|nr:hypothetical protein BOX15_Mlig001345g2 [Macrostomum lignano]